ncbi:MAG: hypothetical protein ACRD8W_21645 [Nitrososphaeraceae archaeon]
MNKLIFAVIIIVVVATVSYSLYLYNYKEAKDAMSLVMPDYMLAYAQPIEDNWNNIPSHAVNGEISIHAFFIGDIPNPGGLNPLDVTFDIKNVTTIRMGIYENDTNFSFNPFEENASVLWQDMFYIENNNQTVKKPFALELIINYVKNVGADVMHSGYGALKIGSNVWNPIAGAVWTTPTGTLIEMDVFSYVDRYPI